MVLLLRDPDVDQLLDMESMLETIEEMLRRYGSGGGFNLARRRVMAPTGELAVMAGGLLHQGVFGVKTYTLVQGGYSFHVSLYDASTGQLLALVQANRLGQLRTGATTGVAVKHLARTDASTVGIIGSGLQAPTQLEAVSLVRNVNMVKAYSPNPAHRREFTRAMSENLGMEVKAVDTNQEAVEDSDIIACIASNIEPVVKGPWLSPGVLVVGAGPTTWRARELDQEAMGKVSRIVVDSLEQAAYEAGDLATAVDQGLLQWDRVVELRQVVAGNIAGRESVEEIFFVKLMGTGIADVAAAKLAYDRARAQGVGTELEF